MKKKENLLIAKCNVNCTSVRGGAERNHLIDVIKGVCILFVIFTHYDWSNEQWHKMLFPFWIDMAVPMFMIISGYVGAMSFSRKGIEKLEDAFVINSILSKCIRFLIPFFIAYLIEVCVEIFILKNNLTSLILMFFTGGKGPGNYYFPVMIQFVFLFPFIYICIQRKGFVGLIIMFLLNAFYEFFQRLYGVNEQCYRLLLLRYIFVIAFGCYIYTNQQERIKKIWVIISFIIGILFILLVEYTNYDPKIIIYWTRTSFIACLYIIPIAYLLLRSKSKMQIYPLEILGKSSFNIFLTQMVYYTYAAEFVYKHISNVVLRLCVNLFICCIFGILFYYFETAITKKLLNYIKKTDLNLKDRINILFLDCKRG